MRNDYALLRLLDEFLAVHPEPTTSDWLALMRAHPQMREEIVDYASVFAGVQYVGEDDARANFDVFASDSQSLTFAVERGPKVGRDPLGFVDTRDGQEQLAAAFGLQLHWDLLMSVLRGQVHPPSRIVGYLAERVKATRRTVEEALALRRVGIALPLNAGVEQSHKVLPTWEDEVRRIVSDPVERRRLLELDAE